MRQIHTEYLTPSRTIEIHENEDKGTVLFIYNHDGIHYRIFQDLASLVEFFTKDKEPSFSFFSEHELDNYLNSTVS